MSTIVWGDGEEVEVKKSARMPNVNVLMIMPCVDCGTSGHTMMISVDSSNRLMTRVGTAMVGGDGTGIRNFGDIPFIFARSIFNEVRKRAVEKGFREVWRGKATCER